MRQAIGIDLGCTNIKAVVVDTSGNILEQSRQETHEQDDSRWKGTVKTIIKDFKNKFRAVDRIGLCAPGLADVDNTCIACMPGRLPGLENFNWSDHAGERIFVLNDAHAALTAEAAFGSGKGMKHIPMITTSGEIRLTAEAILMESFRTESSQSHVAKLSPRR